MKAIDRKLLRDLWQLRSQIATVALVVASAFSGFAGSLATYASLFSARDDFYASARFGEVFADLKRAPRPLERKLRAIPGVDDLRTTVVFDVTLDIPGVSEPVVGRLIGLPEPGESPIDQVVIRQGRLPQDSEPTSVVVSEGFALARHLGPGRSFTALINGTKETLHVVGIGLAPDYIYATRGGAFPDDRNFGVVWMPRRPLGAAFAMEGAFNHVSLRLSRGANPRAVIDALDRLLEPYGGTNAYGRDEQLSHRILSQEIDQWKVIGTLIPSIFLAVTAFLLNVVLSRQITTQREQIAALKAMGYANAALVAHYLRQVAVIVALGIAVGIGVGWWFGNAVTALYAKFFHFPTYRFRMPAWVLGTAAAIIAIGAVGGAIGAVLKAVRLAPAEAMRPPFPGRYRPAIAERLALGRFLTPAARMTFRNMERRPWRAALTTTGIAAAMAIVVSGLFWRDALDYMMDVQFAIAQRASAEVTLTEPMSARSLQEMARMPGVLRAEGAREIPARLTAGHHEYRTVVSGLPAGGELRRLLDENARPVPIPPEGILLTDRLAQRMDHVRRTARTGCAPRQEQLWRVPESTGERLVISTETSLPGVLVLEPRVFGDARGFFMESWNQRVFDDAVGYPVRFVQDNHSLSARGVLRGIHYQIQQAQGKLVRVIAGRVFDVAVDLRRSSPHLGKWFGIELSAENKKQLWVPPGFGHGYLVLSESAEFVYKATDYYAPQYERAVACNDPHVGIRWPLGGLAGAPLLSAKDAAAPNWPQCELFD